MKERMRDDIMKMYCNCVSLYIITWNKGENRKKKKKKKKKKKEFIQSEQKPCP